MPTVARNFPIDIHRSLESEQFNECSVLFRAGQEIERAEIVVAVCCAETFVADDFDKHSGGFFRARTPDDFATGRCIPFIAYLSQPRIEKCVPLFVRTDSESFEVPAIFAIVLRGKPG